MCLRPADAEHPPSCLMRGRTAGLFDNHAYGISWNKKAPRGSVKVAPDNIVTCHAVVDAELQEKLGRIKALGGLIAV